MIRMLYSIHECQCQNNLRPSIHPFIHPSIRIHLILAVLTLGASEGHGGGEKGEDSQKKGVHGEILFIRGVLYYNVYNTKSAAFTNGVHLPCFIA